MSPRPVWTLPCVTTCCLAINFEESSLLFIQLYFCGYSVTLSYYNFEFLDIIPLFGYFYHNLGSWHHVVTLYCIISCSLTIYFEEILWCFVLNMYLWRFLPLSGPIWELCDIIRLFSVILVKIGWFDLPELGDPL